MEVSHDTLFIEELGVNLHFVTLFFALIFYNKYKAYSFYKFFVFYFLVIVIVEILRRNFFVEISTDLYNVYTFFEFNAIALIYYHLIQQKTRLNTVKALAIAFNVVYLLSFIFDY